MTTPKLEQSDSSESPSTLCSARFKAWLITTLIVTFQMGFLLSSVLTRLDSGNTAKIGLPLGILVLVTISWTLLMLSKPNDKDLARRALDSE
jgi:hypothetical protein